jgi:hypothetical protein
VPFDTLSVHEAYAAIGTPVAWVVAAFVQWLFSFELGAG